MKPLTFVFMLAFVLYPLALMLGLSPFMADAALASAISIDVAAYAYSRRQRHRYNHNHMPHMA